MFHEFVFYVSVVLSSFPYWNYLKCKFGCFVCAYVCGSVTTNNLCVDANCFIVSVFLAVKHFSYSNCVVIYVCSSNVYGAARFEMISSNFICVHVLFYFIRSSVLGSIAIWDGNMALNAEKQLGKMAQISQLAFCVDKIMYSKNINYAMLMNSNTCHIRRRLLFCRALIHIQLDSGKVWIKNANQLQTLTVSFFLVWVSQIRIDDSETTIFDNNSSKHVWIFTSFYGNEVHRSFMVDYEATPHIPDLLI